MKLAVIYKVPSRGFKTTHVNQSSQESQLEVMYALIHHVAGAPKSIIIINVILCIVTYVCMRNMYGTIMLVVLIKSQNEYWKLKTIL